MRVLALAAVLGFAGTVAAAPPPTGAHPRMLLDPELRAAWHKQAGEAHGPVIGAIALCDHARTGDDDHAEYQGSKWAEVLQACLVAYAATDSADHAATAIRFFTALLDDLAVVGDHKGGDLAARRDTGYAIRNLGPYTALAYDWLHDARGMTEELRARARERWAAWLDWYGEHGYNAHRVGTNYEAGYLLAATTIAIAEAGEAGAAGDSLWHLVDGVLWGKDMAGGLASGGVLEGGDWGEGWQYGPLSVAEYALAARVARHAGIATDGIAPWLAGLFRRDIYALSPADQTFAGGDTESETPNLAPNALSLAAVALGDASPDDRRYARGELARLRLTDHGSLLYDALAGVGDTPQLPPRASWPTWYLAAGTGTLFTRTRWDEHAVWTVMHCVKAYEIDHHHSDAGNFVMSRGHDDVIVDPSPYGSLSTLTANAPTVASKVLPPDYVPGQGWWGRETAWVWTTQRASGVVAARCDYADQYRMAERETDVPMAIRDLVLLPSHDGTAASMVVIDRASTKTADRPMYLQFRSTAPLALAPMGDIARGVIGETRVIIAGVTRSGGTPALAKPTGKDCDQPGDTRGKCYAARFPVNDYRVEVPGPAPRAVHVISVVAASGGSATSTPISGAGWSGVRVAGPRDAVIVWPSERAGEALSYSTPHGAAVTHVILDGPGTGDGATVTAHVVGADCAVDIKSGGSIPASPLIVTLDDACNVTADAASANAATALGTRPPPARVADRSPRAGCCGAQAAPGSPIAMTLLVGAWWWRRRRRTER